MSGHTFAVETDDEYAARMTEQDSVDASYEALRGNVPDLLAALKPFAIFADALNEEIPDNIAIGIYADGAMRFGPSGGANVGDLRKARSALAKLEGRS